jgi:hypothetical protein
LLFYQLAFTPTQKANTGRPFANQKTTHLHTLLPLHSVVFALSLQVAIIISAQQSINLKIHFHNKLCGNTQKQGAGKSVDFCL